MSYTREKAITKAAVSKRARLAYYLKVCLRRQIFTSPDTARMQLHPVHSYRKETDN